MQKANMLAENIDAFIKFVIKNHENKNSLRANPDKVLQIKLLMEEYRFQILADELLRINQYSWDKKYTLYLVEEFQKGLDVIDQYVRSYYNDLFIFSARIHTLKKLMDPFVNRTG